MSEHSSSNDSMKVMCAYDELVDIETLVPNPRNPNKHPDNQIRLLAKIMKHQGWRSPIVISDRSGFIVKGHGRLLASYLNGWHQVPVDRQDYLNEADEYADMVADNKIAELADTDLSMVLNDVLDFGPDFDFDLLGIPDFKLPEDFAPQSDEDEVPEHVESKTKPGDIYQLGRHRLMCGDSTSIDAVETLMDGEKADMVFTDPPYGMNLDISYQDSFEFHESQAFKDRKQKNYKEVHGDSESFDFLTAYALVELVPEQFWWGADYYCQKIPANGSWFVWNKRTTEGLERMHGNHFELCWSKVKHKREIASITWSGMLGHNRTDDGPSKVHPTMKAVKLIEWFFERFKGEKVIDLFGGSGSTLIACEKTNRICYMMELDPHYCDVIVARWEKYTGRTAELIDGQ